MLRNAVKKGIKAGLKVATLSAREGVRVMRPLIKGGKLSKREAMRAARLLARVGARQARRAQGLIERKVAAEMVRLRREAKRR